MTKSVDFRISGYFSWMILFLGVILALLGLVLFRSHIFISLVFFVASLVIVTTHYRLTINFEQKSYHDYVWILGFKNGGSGKFERVEYLFIKKINVTQKMNNIVASSKVRKEVYTGFLRFSEADKVELTTTYSKTKLIGKLKKIAESLNVKILDYSDGEPKEI